MSSEIRYIFGDILTNEVIEEIPCFGVTMSDSLDGGEFRGSFALDLTGKNNADLVTCTLPGKTWVIVERNEVPIWGGINWSRTYQSQAKSVQLYAKTMDQYLTRRFITTDMEFTATEQRNIFRSLLQTLQLTANTPQWNLPGVFTDETVVDFDVAGSELQTYKEVIDALATTENGFEWRIDVTKESGSYQWTVQVGQPMIGQPLGDTSVVFEYPGNILNYWQNDTLGGSGTNIFVVGSGEGDSMPQIEIVHQDLLNAGFARIDQDVSLKQIEDEDRLEDLAQIQAAVRKAPMAVYTVEMKADREPEFTDWVLGDYARLTFEDPLHPEGLVHPARILKWDYTPPSSDDTEEVRLTFEGEDAE
jgi:hypothetical protein